ncbi:MAG: ABC transporter substrate-binding protein [Thermotogota bacterium]
MVIRRKRVYVAVLVGALSLLLYGTPLLASTPADTLVVGTLQEISLVDPSIDYSFTGGPIFPAAYERLVTFNSHTGKVEPELAVSWDISEDGTVYTFNVRQGVQFHDGSALNAESVKIAFDRTMKINRGPAWMLRDYVKEVAVVSPYVVQITLKAPFGPFLKVLTSSWGMSIMSPKALADHEEAGDLAQGWFHDNMCGTGPYKLVSWTKGQQMVFEKFDAYWRGWDGNHVDRVIVRVVPDPTTLVMMLRNADIDIASYGLVSELGPSLEGAPHLVTESYETYTTEAAFMNTTRAPLDDVRVRRAMSYSFPYEGALQAYGGYAERLIGQLPPSLPGFDPNSQVYHQDLALAKKLLTEAGINEGSLALECTWVTEQPTGGRIAELWQQDLATIGVTLKLTEVNAAGGWLRISSPETTADFTITRWGVDYPDALSNLLPLYKSDLTPDKGGYNIGRYSNPYVDQLLIQASQEANVEKAVLLEQEVQRYITDDAPSIFIVAVPQLVCYQDTVKGFVYDPGYFSSFNLYNMYKE